MENSWKGNFHAGSEMFFPIRMLCEKLPEEDWPSCEALSRLASPIRNCNGLPVRFVESDGGPYEQRIYLDGGVQTRAKSWHDLFNALVWMSFPVAKSLLNQIHFREAAKQSNGARGRMRDIATLFDESGVIVASSDEALSGLLKTFEWKSIFLENRQKVSEEMRFFIFGHGLYEKALAPFTGLTGHGIVFPVEKSFFGLPVEAQLAQLDDRFENVYSEIQSTRDFSPIPLLGVPGWAKENENPCYYDNESYFRSGRRIRNARD